MITFLNVVHIAVSFIMIGVILLQAGKGAEIGAAFGGSSQTIFGSRGPGTFLSKVTVAAAVIFMLTSLFLSILSGGRSVASGINLPAEEVPLAGEIPVSGGVGEPGMEVVPGTGSEAGEESIQENKASDGPQSDSP